MTWHQFIGDDDEGDVACIVGDCAVILAPRVLGSFTLECPAAPCGAPANRGGPCVFAPDKAGPSCTYCGRPGAKSCGAP